MEENDQVRSKVPEIFELLISLHFEKVDEAISPGLTSLKWNSLDIDSYADSAQQAIDKLGLLIDRVVNILTIRVEQEMKKCSSMFLCEFPDGGDPWTPAQFIQHTEVSSTKTCIICHMYIL